MFSNLIIIETYQSHFFLKSWFNFPLVIFLSILNTSLLTFFLKKNAKKLSFCKRNEDGREEEIKIIRLGGIAVFLGFVITFLIFKNTSFFTNLYDQIPYSVIFLGATLIFLIGVVDDIIYLTPRIRLFFQFLVGILIWFYGFKIGTLDFFGSNFNNITLPPILNLFFSVVFIVGIINAINWIDGLDGLASGHIFISSIGTCLILFSNNSSASNFLLPLCLAGSSLGFLLFNFFPAKIYMGDGGSNFLGFMIATITILITQTNNGKTSLLTLIFLNFFPILNMTIVVLERICNRLSPFSPDHRHIHYKLIKLGISHKKSVLLLYCFSTFSILLAFIFHKI